MECVSEKNFKVDNKPAVPIGQLKCKDKVTGDVQDTQQTCGDGGAGNWLNIGFGSGSANKFVTFIQVCHKRSTGSTLFTHHMLHGQAVFSGCVTENHPAFKLDGTIPQVAKLPDEYSQDSQKERFQKISAALGNRITGTTMLVKGHLTPYCDALFPTWKLATMFYVNSAPKWRRVNGANWVRVESLARNQAVRMQKSLQVYTGTHEVLTLDGVQMKFMENGFVEVPKYFWKVLRDPDTGKGIGLITFNNMFATAHEKICPDICTSSKWNHRHAGTNGFSDFSRGFTYCCDVNELRKKIPNIPSAMATTGVMECITEAPESKKRGRGE